MGGVCASEILQISIHALRGEGDGVLTTCSFATSNFNPRPPWGGRPRLLCCDKPEPYFNPRPPWGGRLKPTRNNRHLLTFQSTPSVGRATLNLFPPIRYTGISIHALRGEGDHEFPQHQNQQRISIHALRGEGDQSSMQATLRAKPFQSTPSVGRATAPTKSPPAELIYFNPRPPWGGRRWQSPDGLH